MMPATILLTETDYSRLSSLFQFSNSIPEVEKLELEVERADIVPSLEVPPTLVTMNSTFRYLDVTENKTAEMTIVYPQHANLEENKISVLAPKGAALIGLREGQEIDWTLPNGQIKRLRVLEVLYQPEASGDDF